MFWRPMITDAIPCHDIHWNRRIVMTSTLSSMTAPTPVPPLTTKLASSKLSVFSVHRMKQKRSQLAKCHMQNCQLSLDISARAPLKTNRTPGNIQGKNSQRNLKNVFNCTSWWRSRSWWRHQMKTFSALLAICAGNSPVSGEFPAQRPLTRRFDVYFDLRLNERLSKHSWGWWLETPSRPLWRHSNVMGHLCAQWYSSIRQAWRGKCPWLIGNNCTGKWVINC